MFRSKSLKLHDNKVVVKAIGNPNLMLSPVGADPRFSMFLVFFQPFIGPIAAETLVAPLGQRRTTRGTMHVSWPSISTCTRCSKARPQINMGSSPMFTVRRQMPELVRPARPMPRETKLVSDIDDQQGLRFQVPIIQFYRGRPTSNCGEPAKVIKEALAETLVFYYPMAGRLREGRGRKLAVDCTGEGVIFIEADANVTLHELSSGHQLQPPFPFLADVLFDVPGSSQILHTPLLLIQVTQLRCGGFILGIRFNHAITDSPGIFQFLKALGEIIKEASSPSITPVWMRELFSARDPPTQTRVHCEYDDVPAGGTVLRLDDHDMVHTSFFFDASKLSALRTYLPPHLRHKYSIFDILTACLWRCRTLALQTHDLQQQVRVLYAVNARGRFDPPLPEGFYGNSAAYPVAVTTAGELASSPLEYAVELVTQTKSSIAREYFTSVADLMVMRGRPHYTCVQTYAVMDMTRVGFQALDIGWGKPAYGGIAIVELEAFPGATSFLIPMKKDTEEGKGVLVPISLPKLAMQKFVREMEMLTNPADVHIVRSSL